MTGAGPAGGAIHVVAAVLLRGEQLCVSRRRADAPHGGKWELPGGKLEPGETPRAGLARELREELGIEVRAARPFVTLRHAYPDGDVLLDVWRVTDYAGEPHGRESQALRWVPLPQLDPAEFPEADRPVLRRLQLPPLYLITPAASGAPDELIRRVEAALAAGARLLQLRDPRLERARFCALARALAARCRRAGARLLVNAEPSWLDECEADGVHLNARRLTALPARPVAPNAWLAASCHDATELARALALGADFAVLGPVQPTASHPGSPVLGWDGFGALVRDCPLPLYAIGGMRAQDGARARAYGAQGVAMISGVWDQEQPGAAIRAVLATAQEASAR
jgi:8-oxo-dGTP diphosphatase